MPRNLLLVQVTLAVLLFLWSSVGAYPRMFPPDGAAYTGYLTWKDGQGGISWDVGSASEDDVRTPNPFDAVDPPTGNSNVDSYVNYAQGYVENYVEPRAILGKDPRQHPDDWFTSQPLPVDLHINASRGIDVNFLMKDFGPAYRYGPQQYLVVCHYDVTSFNVKLYVGDQVTGATLTVAAVSTSFGADYVPAEYFSATYQLYGKTPAGYCLLPLRFAPEVDRIPAGTVVKVQVEHYQESSQGYKPKFGLQGDHRSAIRFNIYSEEEEVYRFTSAFGAVGGGGGRSSSESASPGAMLLAVPLLWRGRSRSGLVLALLLAGSVAGCVGNGTGSASVSETPGQGGSIEQTIVASNGTQKANDVGTIFGTVQAVQDGYALPVPDAKVALVRTGWFTQTNLAGRFSFAEIPSGSYKLRIEKAGYMQFEGTIGVSAGAYTKADVELYAINVSEPGKALHRHDYWAGRSKVTLVEDLDVGNLSTDETSLFFALPRTSTLTNNFIFPGTEEVEVSVSWDDGGRLTPVPVVWLAFRDRSDTGAWNWSVMAPRGSGEPFHIRTTWEMGDQGHSRSSGWKFALFLPYWEANGVQRRDTPVGPFLVTVTIHRGPSMPLEPSHPDEWVGRRTLTVAEGDKEFWSGATWPAKERVPTDSQWFEVVATQSARADLTDLDLQLNYFSGITNCGGTKATAPAGERVGLVTSWKFQIKAEETDGLYVTTPTWCFELTVPSEQQSYLYYAQNYSSDYAGTKPVRMNLTAVVHGEPMAQVS